jgi:hypothetical protein
MSPSWPEAVAALIKYIATPKGDGRRLVSTQLFHMLFEKLGRGELADITAELKSNQIRQIRAKTQNAEADVAVKLMQAYKIGEEAKAIANNSSQGAPGSDSAGLVAARERAEQAISRLVQDGGGLQVNGEQLRLMAETEKANELRVDAELPLAIQAEGQVSATVIVEGVGVSVDTGTARAEGAVAGSAEPAGPPTHRVAASATSAYEATAAAVNAEGMAPTVVVSDAITSQQRKVAADVARGHEAVAPEPPPPPTET